MYSLSAQSSPRYEEQKTTMRGRCDWYGTTGELRSTACCPYVLTRSTRSSLGGLPATKAMHFCALLRSENTWGGLRRHILPMACTRCGKEVERTSWLYCSACRHTPCPVCGTELTHRQLRARNREGKPQMTCSRECSFVVKPKRKTVHNSLYAHPQPHQV